MPSVLFVCTANMIRSPMAMALFMHHLGSNSGGWRVESAGTWARQGDSATITVRQLMAERGLDLSLHRSRIVTRELLQPFNLILTMEKGHKEALQIEFPQLAGRVYLLSEMAGQVYEIDDPVGRGVDAHREIMLEIERILTQGFEKIVTLAG